MKVRSAIAVVLLSAVSMWAQAAPQTGDAGKPAEHEHAMCKRDKSAKMDCCKKDKDGKMAKEMDCCKKGKCAREKKTEEKKS